MPLAGHGGPAYNESNTYRAMFRFLLLLAILAVSVLLIAAHGVRGLAIALVLIIAVGAMQSRAWQTIERPLVRLTGSRMSAAALILGVIIVVSVAIDVYTLIR